MMQADAALVDRLTSQRVAPGSASQAPSASQQPAAAPWMMQAGQLSGEPQPTPVGASQSNVIRPRPPGTPLSAEERAFIAQAITFVDKANTELTSVAGRAAVLRSGGLGLTPQTSPQMARPFVWPHE